MTLSPDLNNLSGPPYVISIKDAPALPDAIHLDGRKMQTSNDFYDEISRSFNLPSYFGRNYNALSEVLCDLSWMRKDRYLVIIYNSGSVLCDASSEAKDGFLDTMNHVGREWHEIGGYDMDPRAFHTILSTSDFPA